MPMLGRLARIVAERRRSPFATCDELSQRLRRDIIDIERQIMIQDIPRRGVAPIPPSVVREWCSYASWVTGAIQYLGTSRSTAELNDFLREWQRRRGRVVVVGSRWERRADVLPIGSDIKETSD